MLIKGLSWGRVNRITVTHRFVPVARLVWRLGTPYLFMTLSRCACAHASRSAGREADLRASLMDCAAAQDGFGFGAAKVVRNADKRDAVKESSEARRIFKTEKKKKGETGSRCET